MSVNTPGDISHHLSNGTNPFVCNVCQKTYGRIDHLARHFRSHTNEKPFRCDECGKTFARADLLKRHATLHTSTEQSGKKRKIRASQACTQCATIKVKCDQDKPCKRCKTKGLECRVDVSSSSTMYRSDDHDSPPEQWTGQSDFRPYNSEQHLPGPTSIPAQASVVQPMMMPGSNHPSSMMEDPSLTDFLKEVLHPAEQAHASAQPRTDTTWNGNFAPRDLMDFSQDLSLDFNDLDAVLSGGWDTWLDPSLVPAVYDKPTDRTVSDGSTPSIDGSINMGSAAYNRSAWKWVPDTGKGRASKDQSLASILIDGKASMPQRGSQSQLLTAQDRDRIVALLLSSCDKPNFQKVVTMFPAVNVLDFFLHECLVTMEHSIDSWIHIPTFRSGDAIAELLTAMVAQGAVLSRTSHAQLFGYSLQEKARLALPELFERDNSMTRNLQALQASAICLDIGTWSGNKRTMELAEAAALPLVTMIRRSGGFRRSRGVAPGPSPGDSEDMLQQKWRKWVEAESFKRLAYHVFLYTVQVSVGFQTPPLLSYAEITLELPAPQAIWRAKTAEEWRDQYFAYGSGGPLPTFVSSMCDPQTMGFVRSYIDLELTLYLVLLSHWCLAWDFTQLSSANKAQANNDIQWAGTMLASSKCQELCKLLDSFYVVIEDWRVFIPKEVHMMSQLLRMNLCVAFEDLQLIAGKEGEEEARRVFPHLKQWYRSPECRQALWHAGQVLRAARRPAGRSPNASQTDPSDAPWLRDFNAVALYHAGLAFWVYGLLSRAISMEEGYNAADPAVDYNGEPIRLDGNDEELTNMDRHRFIGLNKGRAVISALSPWSNLTSTRVSSPQTTVGTAAARGPITEPPHTRQETVPLDDPKLVMEVMINALTPSSQPPGSNNRTSQPQQTPGPQRPAMVENLVQLMRDLGEAASAV